VWCRHPGVHLRTGAVDPVETSDFRVIRNQRYSGKIVLLLSAHERECIMTISLILLTALKDGSKSAGTPRVLSSSGKPRGAKESPRHRVEVAGMHL